MSHMFFGQAVSFALSKLLATHPSLEERIRRVNPRFQPSIYRARRPTGEEKPVEKTAPAGRRSADAGVAWGRSAAESAMLVGALEGGKIDQAARLLGAIPAPLREALREPQSAAAAVAALLAAPKEEVLEQQLTSLKTAGIGAMVEPIRAAAALSRTLSEAFHLPLIDLALPALKAAPEETKTALLGALQAMAYADRRLSLHEFVVLTLMRHQLAPKGKPAAGRKTIAELRGEVAVLLSVISHAGTRPDAAGARGAALENALRAGAKEVGIEADAARSASLSLESTGAALEAAKALAPLQKALLGQGLFAAVSADGVIRVGEAELMRMIGAVLDCPLPPLLEEIDPATLVA
jgi:hypothetical protein